MLAIAHPDLSVEYSRSQSCVHKTRFCADEMMMTDATAVEYSM